MGKSIFVILISFLSISFCYGQKLDYGLEILSHPLPKKDFTTLSLNNGEVIDWNDEFTITFQLWLFDRYMTGSFCRLITDRGEVIEMVFSRESDGQLFVVVVTEGEAHRINCSVKKEKWTDVELSIYPKKGILKVKYDKSETIFTSSVVNKGKGSQVFFGYYPLRQYTPYVASVCIKDIRLLCGGQEVGNYKLQCHNNDTTYDSCQGQVAIGKNTKWVIDETLKWKLVLTKTFHHFPSIAFDSAKETFYMTVGDNMLYKYNYYTHYLDSLRTVGGNCVARFPNQLMFISCLDTLLSYDVNENLYSFFCFKTLKWGGTEISTLDNKAWNNSVNYNSIDSTLVSFGGYGHFRYSNELTISYPYHPEIIPKKIILKEIPPRYSPATAIVDNVLYIFGGNGSVSGYQEIQPRNFQDFYAVDLKTYCVTKLWERQEYATEEEFIPGEHMIYNGNGYFYLLCKRYGGKMIRINLDSPFIEDMSYPMYAPLKTEYIYGDIFYSSLRKMMYTVFILSNGNGESTVLVYEMSEPVASLRMLTKTLPPIVRKDGKTKVQAILIFFSIFLLCVVILICRCYWKKRMLPLKSKSEKIDNKFVVNEKKTDLVSEKSEMEIFDEVSIVPYTKSCIYLMGCFQVIDREGKDITSNFTPTLRTLLFLLILWSKKKAKSISGQQIIQIMWSDKMEVSARNNRNTYLSRLRFLLENVGVKLVNNNSLWEIQLDSDTHCDYMEAIDLLYNNSRTLEDTDLLVTLLLRGVLSGMDNDWADDSKNELSDLTINFLSQELKRSDLSDERKLRMADILFYHDYLSEEALQTKCYIYYQQGKKGLSLNIYNEFCKKYKSSLGVDYKYSFNEILAH